MVKKDSESSTITSSQRIQRAPRSLFQEKPHVISTDTPTAMKQFNQ